MMLILLILNLIHLNIGNKLTIVLQVASKRAAGPTRVNNAPQNKRFLVLFV
jgi:hypothetical protein